MTPLEAAQLLGDILEDFMELDSDRVVIYGETFDAPKDQDLYIIISDEGGAILNTQSEIDSDTEIETMSTAMHMTFIVEVTSRGRAALERHAEVYMALRSTRAIQIADANGVRFFRGGRTLDLTFVEGPGILRRFRMPVIVSMTQTKTTQPGIIDKFTAPTVEEES